MEWAKPPFSRCIFWKNASGKFLKRHVKNIKIVYNRMKTYRFINVWHVFLLIFFNSKKFNPHFSLERFSLATDIKWFANGHKKHQLSLPFIFFKDWKYYAQVLQVLSYYRLSHIQHLFSRTSKYHKMLFRILNTAVRKVLHILSKVAWYIRTNHKI